MSPALFLSEAVFRPHVFRLIILPLCLSPFFVLRRRAYTLHALFVACVGHAFVPQREAAEGESKNISEAKKRVAENESSANMAEASYRAEAHVGVSASLVPPLGRPRKMSPILENVSPIVRGRARFSDP